MPLLTALPTLETPRLRLRALTTNDRGALPAIYSDPEVMRYAADPPLPDLAAVDRLLASVARLQANGSSFEWGIELRSDATLIGTCGLHSFAEPPTAAEIGCLLARAAWGRGLMHEALTALMAFARTLGLLTLHADIDTANVRSLRLFQRLGFVPAGATRYTRRLSTQPSESA